MIKKERIGEIKKQLKDGVIDADFLYDIYYVNHSDGIAFGRTKHYPNLTLEEFKELIEYAISMDESDSRDN